MRTPILKFATTAFAALTFLAITQTASAASVTVVDPQNGPSSILVAANPGEDNIVEVRPIVDGFLVKDEGNPIVASGCGQPQPDRVACPAEGVTSVYAVLGDGENEFNLIADLEAEVTGEGAAKNVFVSQGSEDVRFEGSDGPDQFAGGSGDDQLYPGDGDDVLRGGPGDDVLDGGEGSDTLFADPGADELDGDNGYDTPTTRRGPGRCRSHSTESLTTVRLRVPSSSPRAIRSRAPSRQSSVGRETTRSLAGWRTRRCSDTAATTTSSAEAAPIS